jgi:hypothetical protein
MKRNALVLGMLPKMKRKFITRVSLEKAKNLADLTDWERIKNMSDEEIEENAINDPDNQPLPYPPSEKLKRRDRGQREGG